jgi:hypothetical protein
LTEDDVQSYKYWLFEHDREDCFENLVDWVEMKVHIMAKRRKKLVETVKEEAQELTTGETTVGSIRVREREDVLWTTAERIIHRGFAKHLKGYQ